MNKELDSIISKAGISVTDTSEYLLIRSSFKLLNKANIGVILFLIMGVFLVIFFLLSEESRTSILLGVLIGGLVSLFSILTLLKQVFGFVKITKSNIKFLNNFKKHQLPLSSKMKVRVKTDTEYIDLSSQPSSKSSFYNVELYLFYNNLEYKIFAFQVEDQHSKEANKLGTELAHLIKGRINASNVNT